MPELPEVETTMRDLLRAGIAGRRIGSVSVARPRCVAPLTAAEFAGKVRHETVTGLRRRGKYLVWALNGKERLLLHLRMSGRLLLNRSAAASGHDVLVLRFDDGRALHFHDPRKFGRCLWTGRPEEILARLGPEPLENSFSAAVLADSLRNRRRIIKALLLDQCFLAGLGNIYTDEALWTARIAPRRPGDSLLADEIRRLHRAIRSVLRGGIEAGGTSLGDGRANFRLPSGKRGNNAPRLKVYGRAGEKCPRCGRAIERIILAGRGTHRCAGCQR